ncbi:MAG: Mur ligase family protein [Acidihalobacter sp.]
MAIVTIFSGLYCHGEEVAAGVAGRLKYDRIEDKLLHETERRFKVPVEKLVRSMTGPAPFFNRVTRERQKNVACLKVVLDRQEGFYEGEYVSKLASVHLYISMRTEPIFDGERATGVEFDTATFTNLSRDHLDYHGSLEAYAAAKRRLFERPELRAAVINRDDPFGTDCLGGLASAARPIGYSLQAHPQAGLQGRFARLDRHGLELDVRWNGRPARLATSLLGTFNGANLLAALGALLGLGADLDAAVEALSGVTPVPGRMEIFTAPNRPLTVLDYAHTPNALELVLSDFRSYVPGRVWCVLGAMGNRDRGKRPLMAAVAARLSDRIILTDSIPDGEDPASIIEDLSAGLPPGTPAEVIRSREAAIAHALASAGPDDGVLITGTGKGNERTRRGCQGQPQHSDYDQVSACMEAAP